MTEPSERRDRGAPRSADETASAALLGRLLDHVVPRLPVLVDDFYGRLARHPGIAEIVDRLTPDELSHLERQQANHLAHLLSPAASERMLHDRSREIGRIHAMVGVGIDWNVDAVADHRRTMLTIAAELFSGEEHAVVHTMLGERFMEDLQGALLGYRDLDNAQHRVVLNVSQAISDARTVTDLTRGVLEALSCLDGISVGFFGRPDVSGQLQFEIGAGVGIDALVDSVASHEMPPISMAHTPTGPATSPPRPARRCSSRSSGPSSRRWPTSRSAPTSRRR